ncbi:hypothetical protein [Actinoplanes sp. NPDC048796]|uniref:hypothetical protein n=1 Tax=unclassified Actinoplanes TaxID=2626549 RepID=UPI00340F28C4
MFSSPQASGGGLAYAERRRYNGDQSAHAHRLVEIAVAIGGEGMHRSLAGLRQVSAGDVTLAWPGVRQEYQQCEDLEIYHGYFPVDLLNRELFWVRHDALLGGLLWTAPASMRQRDFVSARLGGPALQECVTHLDGVADLRREVPATHRAASAGRLLLLLGNVARANSGSSADRSRAH